MNWYMGPYVFWIFLAVIIISGSFFSYLKSRSRDRTIRDLAERGQPIPNEMFGPSYGGSARSGLLIGGLVMLFIGIALAAFMGSASPDMTGGIHHGFLVGLFPGGIGLALILSYLLLGRGKDKGGY